MNNLSLDTTIIYPENKNSIKKAIILFHGYGGDGKDISMLSYNWTRHLENTIILCPNAHQKCSINPLGYQWFDLSNDEESFVINQTMEAEKKIIIYIEEIKKKFKLNNKDICLSGFSQGCMISINIGLTSNEDYNCIVGFSGKIINKEDLSNRIKSKANTLLIHGSLDSVVPPNNLLDAKDFFIRHKVNIETKLIENCEHSIPLEASSHALQFIKKNFNK